jgi:hypothetical protein
MGFLGSIGQLLGFGGGSSSKPQVVMPPGNAAALNLLQSNLAPLASHLADINANTLQSTLGYGASVALGFQDYMNNLYHSGQHDLAGLIDNYQNGFGQNLSNWANTIVNNVNDQANNVNNTISDYYRYNQQHLTDVYNSTLNNYNQFLNGVWGLAKQNEGQGFDRLNNFMTGIWDLAKQNEQQGYSRLDNALDKSIGIANDISNNTQFRDQIKGDYTDLLNKSQDVYNAEFRKSSGNLAALGMANTPALQQTQSDLINKLQYDVLGKQTSALNAEDMLREKISGDTLSALAQQYPQLMTKLASEYSGQQTNLMNTGMQTEANLINTNLNTQANLMNTGMQTEANLMGQKAGALSASDTLYGNLGVTAATHKEDLTNQAYTNVMQAGTNFLNNFYNNSLGNQSNLLNHYFEGSAQFESTLPTLAGQYATALTQATPQQQYWNLITNLASSMNGINSAVTNTQGGGSSFGNALGTVGGVALGNSLFGGSSTAAGGSGWGLSNLAGNIGSAVSSVGSAIGSVASWVGGLLGESTSRALDNSISNNTINSNNLDALGYDNNTIGQVLGSSTSNTNLENLSGLQQFLANYRQLNNVSNNPYVQLFNSPALANYPTEILSKVFTPDVLNMMSQGLDLAKIAPNINGGDLSFLNDKGYSINSLFNAIGY